MTNMKKSKLTGEQIDERRTEVLNAMTRIGEDPSDYEIFCAVECGLHSHIPLCCIAFFCKAWLPWVVASPAIDGDNDIDELFDRGDEHEINAFIQMTHYYDMMERNGFTPDGYIPCPSCLLSRQAHQVTLAPCDFTLTERQYEMGLRRLHNQEDMPETKSEPPEVTDASDKVILTTMN
jgi:hypothetical protein